MNRTIISASDLQASRPKRIIPFGDSEGIVLAYDPATSKSETAKNLTGGAGGSGTSDGYLGRLVKYIPPDVIGAFISIEAAIRAAPTTSTTAALAWGIFAIMFGATPIYLWRIGGVKKKSQVAVSTIAFAVWAFAYSGPPFSSLGLSPVWTAVILGLFTFAVPFFDPVK